MCLFISFCTQEIDSTPPATMASASPAMIRCAASAIVCSPDEQKRLTVAPGTRHRTAGAQRDLARDVPAGCTLRQRAADENVVDLLGREPGARDRVLHGVTAERRAMGHVERAAPALGKPGARGGNDQGVGHGGSFLTPTLAPRGERQSLNVFPSAARRASSGAGVQKAASAAGCDGEFPHPALRH